MDNVHDFISVIYTSIPLHDVVAYGGTKGDLAQEQYSTCTAVLRDIHSYIVFI